MALLFAHILKLSQKILQYNFFLYEAINHENITWKYILSLSHNDPQSTSINNKDNKNNEPTPNNKHKKPNLLQLETRIGKLIEPEVNALDSISCYKTSGMTAPMTSPSSSSAPEIEPTKNSWCRVSRHPS